VVGAAIFCVGAYDRYRGMMLDMLGRHDEAVCALDAALALERSVESPPLTARTRVLARQRPPAPRQCRRSRTGHGRARPLHRDGRTARHGCPSSGGPRAGGPASKDHRTSVAALETGLRGHAVVTD
jgi:hypothetical protein